MPDIIPKVLEKRGLLGNFKSSWEIRKLRCTVTIFTNIAISQAFSRLMDSFRKFGIGRFPSFSRPFLPRHNSDLLLSKKSNKVAPEFRLSIELGKCSVWMTRPWWKVRERSTFFTLVHGDQFLLIDIKWWNFTAVLVVKGFELSCRDTFHRENESQIETPFFRVARIPVSRASFLLFLHARKIKNKIKKMLNSISGLFPSFGLVHTFRIQFPLMQIQAGAKSENGNGLTFNIFLVGKFLLFRSTSIFWGVVSCWSNQLENVAKKYYDAPAQKR